MRRFTILGCGGASGVPAIGPDWGRCDPAEPRNRRRRVSILVENPASGDGPLLVDTSPDLREQLLAARVGRIGAASIELLSLNPEFEPTLIERGEGTVAGTVVLRWCGHG